MIDLALHGQPAQCRAAAYELDLLVRQIGAAEEELDYTAAIAARCWQGLAAEDFRRLLGGITAEAKDLHDQARRLVGALEDFALALDRVRIELDAARYDAQAAGLAVHGDAIAPPQPLPIVPMLSAYGSVPCDPTVDLRVRTYEQCQSRVEYARTLERRAHDDLQSAARTVLRQPFLERWLGKLGLLPADSTPGVIACGPATPPSSAPAPAPTGPPRSGTASSCH